jgi:hypothetical protein
MDAIERLIDDIFSGQERMSADEIYRRAVAAELPVDAMTRFDGLPEGEYSADEVLEVLSVAPDENEGIPASALTDEDLMRELASLHRTRHETLLHGSTQALQRHSERTADLEFEYLRRRPEREVDYGRLREGARQRG